MKPLSLSKPHIVIMVGIPGAGKTFFAEHFAETFKAPIVSLDIIKKNIFGKITSEKAHDIIANKAAQYLLDEVLKTGRTIVYDGKANTQNERLLITRKFKKHDYEPLFVWVQTENLTAKKRVTKNANDRDTASIEFDEKVKNFEQPTINDKTVVISGKHTYNSQLKIVLKNLVEPRSQTTVVQNPRITNHRNNLIR